jgi:hypothetical protein
LIPRTRGKVRNRLGAGEGATCLRHSSIHVLECVGKRPNISNSARFPSGVSRILSLVRNQEGGGGPCWRQRSQTILECVRDIFSASNGPGRRIPGATANHLFSAVVVGQTKRFCSWFRLFVQKLVNGPLRAKPTGPTMEFPDGDRVLTGFPRSPRLGRKP